MDKYRIFIADDHAIVASGIEKIMDGQVDFQVVGHASSGLQAVRAVSTLKPDLVIMDIAMGDLNGIQATYKIKVFQPKTAVVIYSMHAHREYICRLFQAGISAYVCKDDPISDLLLAVRAVRRGGTYFTAAVSDFLFNHLQRGQNDGKCQDPYESLTCREKEILQLIAEGYTVKTVADKLCLSHRTVESHKYKLMEKLSLSSLSDLIKYAIKKKLIFVG